MGRPKGERGCAPVCTNTNNWRIMRRIVGLAITTRTTIGCTIFMLFFFPNLFFFNWFSCGFIWLISPFLPRFFLFYFVFSTFVNFSKIHENFKLVHAIPKFCTISRFLVFLESKHLCTFSKFKNCIKHILL